MADFKTTDPAVEELSVTALAQSDPVATMVRDRFNRAKRWRGQERVGDRTVNQILNDSFNQYHGVLSCGDLELVAESGIDVNVSLTKHKCDVLTAWTRDLLLNSSDAPFTVDPTPIPELSDRAKQRVLQRVKASLYTPGGFSGGPQGVIDMVRAAKAQVLTAENASAREAATAMQLLINDQLVTSGFRSQFMDFLFNFSLYPYAVMLGPIPEMKPVFQWSGNKPVTKLDAVLSMRNIDPFNYYWSPDSSGAGKGTYDMIVDTMTRQRLIECSSMQGYVKKNVLAALEHYGRGTEERDWLNPRPDRPAAGMMPWGMDESIDVVRHYGMLSGEELAKYGLSVDKDQFHECEAHVIGYWTIRLLVNPSPNVTERPIYSTNYQKLPGKLPGYGLGQTLRDIERSFMVALRGTLENVGYSIAPLSEVDFSRVQRYMAEDQIGNIMAGTMVPVDPDLTGGGRPAHYFHTVPSVSGQMTSLMTYFMELADRTTGLPAALSGQPIGTGVNRTFRGIMALYGNALKGVQSSLANMDSDLFERMGNAFFNFNMKYAKDDSVRGDAKVKARGTAGLLQKEIAKQGTAETLQFVAQLAQSGAADPAVIKWAVDQALLANGVPQRLVDQHAVTPAAENAPPGANTMNQVSNPGVPQ